MKRTYEFILNKFEIFKRRKSDKPYPVCSITACYDPAPWFMLAYYAEHDAAAFSVCRLHLAQIEDEVRRGNTIEVRADVGIGTSFIARN